MTIYTTKQVAKLSGLTVRTLHHYDALGLLTPGRAGDNNYRTYTEADLERLQQILFFRTLEFPLDQIKMIIGSTDYDPIKTLTDHARVIKGMKDRYSQIYQNIQETITKLTKGDSMNTNTMFNGLSDQMLKEYQEEAAARWGDTDAYKESVINVKKMGKAGLQKVLNESNEIMVRLSQLMDRPITDPEVQHCIAEHRANIGHFYKVNDQIYRGLAEMYVADPRFAKHYDDVKSGLADYISRAMLTSLNS